METGHLLVVCAAVLGAVQAGQHDIYSGHSVYGVHVRSKAHQMLLHDLEPILDLDVWQHGIVSEREAFIRVAPENKELFLNALEEEGIEHYVHLEDVAQDLEERDNELKSWRASKQNRLLFQDYPRHEEVNAYMDRIALQHPDLATVVTAGKSFEGRDIKYIKISTSNFEDSSKPIYMLTAMIHAREWVTTPTLLYSMHRLVENLRSQDQDLREDIDWIIMPLLNPDGYEYSHTTDRLWRKTRSYRPEFNDTCWGVDGNRNYDSVHFGVIGASADPCNVTYPGPEPFSEVETAYVRDVLLEHVDRIQLFMDVHSFGNYITYGYGDGTLPPNVVELHLMSSVMGAAFDVKKLPEANFYRVGNSGILMYPTAGCAQDYAQSIGIPFSLTLELPSYGHGFVVPPQYINHINDETWHGIAESARLARTFHRKRSSLPVDPPVNPPVNPPNNN
ncbi:carboxypeptidase B [Spodoptera frugiperda]|uniref:Carboxypeptidase B n=1 Tax=Spodoptera frugiperda TaxID=7108 RepID=A0A9R0DD61_SPOFR|nr:carboxypeptidase B [Spodoptera frugiperda]